MMMQPAASVAALAARGPGACAALQPPAFLPRRLLGLPRPSRRALVTAALTVSVHVLLVFAWQHLPRASAQQGKAHPPALQVSLLPGVPPTLPYSGSADAAAVQMTDPALSSAMATDGTHLPAADAAAAPMPTTLPTPTATQPPPGALTASAPASAQDVSNPVATPGAGRSGAIPHPALAPVPAAPLQRASNEWAYLPAAELDRRPSPEGDITLPFPESENLPRGTRVSAVLVLYVGADGAVDRVEFAQSALPPAFARTATETFARVRMRPGMKDGQPRRAMMKIEVEFEAPAFKRPATDVATTATTNVATTAVIESSRSWQDSQ
jgi:outer membrane biosynthesis protein TonB